MATRVVATGESLWYEGNTEDLPPQVEEAMDDYVDESYAKNVIVLPLRKPGRSGRGVGRWSQCRNDRRSACGTRDCRALIVEQIETDLPREILEPRIDLVYEHSTRALSNALDFDSIFLMPLWRAIGKSTLLVKGRNLPKTLLAAGVILAVILALFLIRTDFNLKGGRCVCSRSNAAMSSLMSDGRITEVLVQEWQDSQGRGSADPTGEPRPGPGISEDHRADQ